VQDRGELAQFLRSRRERLRPEDVGLAPSGRRRTPGLRREEVATLAGLSIDYLVRLEQGRDTNPSAPVLTALAQALRLTEDEKHHLGKLAVLPNNASLCPGPAVLTREVRPTVRALLDQLSPTPAFVVGPLNDVLAWNDAWALIAGRLGLLDDDAPNLARYVFLHPAAPQVLPDWSVEADKRAAELRAAEARWGGEPSFVTLVEDLHATTEFAARWDAHIVAEPQPGTVRLAHPDAGVLRIGVELLAVTGADQTIITWLPHDDTTEAAMRTLLATPLHVVRRA